MSNAPFGFDKPSDSPGFLLWQVTMLWQRAIRKALEPYDIGHAHFVIMALLFWLNNKDEDPTQVKIAAWAKLDKMVVSKALKKLALQGLVVRAEHTADSRAKSVELTAKGKTLVKKLVPIVELIDQQFFGVLPERSQAMLISALQALTEDRDA